MELIDKETAYKELSEYYHHTAFIQHLCLAEALDRVPVVDAIPVQWLYNLAEKKESETDIKLSLMIKGVVALWHREQEKRNG